MRHRLLCNSQSQWLYVCLVKVCVTCNARLYSLHWTKDSTTSNYILFVAQVASISIHPASNESATFPGVSPPQHQSAVKFDALVEKFSPKNNEWTKTSYMNILKLKFKQILFYQSADNPTVWASLTLSIIIMITIKAFFPKVRLIWN